MNMENVKNCPFCNEKPELHTPCSNYSNRTFYNLQCENCKAKGRIVKTDDCNTLELAIEMWDERA